MMCLKKSKIVIFALICMLVCAGLCVPAAAEQGTDQFGQSVLVLQRLGVLNAEETGAAADAVSRAEFTALAVRAMGLDTAENTGGSGFSDVPDVHPYAGVIEQARQMGLVSGGGGSMFYPDDKISYTDAAKILVTLTGYHRKVSAGTSSAYMAMANQIGIMRGTGTQNYAMAARRDVLYKMLENALEADILKQTGFGSESSFESQRGQTVMREYLKIDKRKGMVTATPKTAYNGPSELAADQIGIDGATYTVQNDRGMVEESLGYQVTYYVDISDPGEDFPPIVLLQSTMAEERVVVVNADDIKAETTNQNLSYYTYSESGSSRSQTARIEATANVIYNGVYWCKAHMLENDDLQPMTGNVKLVDSDGNGSYDLVIIVDIRTIVVNEVNNAERTISDYYKRPTLKIDISADVQVVKKGKVIQLSDIKSWDVLAVKEDKGSTLVDIEVATGKAAGKITAMGDDTVTVEEEELELSESLKAFYAENDDPKYQMRVGDNGNFYLDVDGRIAGADIGSASDNNYGYLVKFGMASGMSTTCQMQLLVKSNQLLTLDAASKLTIDGIGGQNGTDLFNRFSELEAARPVGNPTVDNNDIKEAYRKQNYLIAYKMNEAGEVSEVDTVIDNPEENGKGLKISYPANNKRYKVYNKFSGYTVTGNFGFNNKTVMFNVPPDPKDEKGFNAKNNFTHDTFYDVTGYNKDNGLVSVVVNFVKGGSGGSGGDSNKISTGVSTDNVIGVVDKVTKATTEEGEVVPKIYMMTGGTMQGFTVIPDVEIPDLKMGDVVIFGKNYQGYIDALRVLFQPGDEAVTKIESPGGAYEWLYGMVYEKYPDVLNILTDMEKLENPKDTDLIPYLVNRFARIYVVDMVEEEIRVGSKSDIFAYETSPDNPSMVYMKIRYDDPKEMVVYKFK